MSLLCGSACLGRKLVRKKGVGFVAVLPILGRRFGTLLFFDNLVVCELKWHLTSCAVFRRWNFPAMVHGKRGLDTRYFIIRERFVESA
jgi:hypothetical protein